MKTFLFVLALTLVAPFARAQPVIQEATAAEVAAATIGTKYVSPRRLAAGVAHASTTAALGSNALALTAKAYNIKEATWSSATSNRTFTFASGATTAGNGIVADMTFSDATPVIFPSAYRNGAGSPITTYTYPAGHFRLTFSIRTDGSTVDLNDEAFTEGDIPLNRQTFSNANATIAAGYTILEQTGTMSASRTATLAAASSYRAGQRVFILDVSGTVTTSNPIIVARAGSDTINGASTSQTLDTAYGSLVMESDGTSKWTIVTSSGLGWGEVTLTDGATVTQTMIPGLRMQNAKVTLGGNRTLAFSGLTAGMEGNLRVIQDGTGSRGLTLPANSRVNGSATTVTLLTAAAAENILSWYSPDGTAIRWTNGTY